MSAALLLPSTVGGQLVFGWPIRTMPQPEAVLTGAEAVFWNPGSLAGRAGSAQEVWITHVDGPDATGVGGVATAGVVELPRGIRGAVGYWHLGISNITRTTTSPEPEPGDVHVAEDVAVLAFSADLNIPAGAGMALRYLRGSVAGDAESRVEWDMGFHFRPDLPLEPRMGFTVRGLGADPSILAGTEFSLPPLASGRIPLRVGYGLETEGGRGSLEQRLSVRGSWQDQVHLGLGLNHMGEGAGWTTLWMVGAEIGRYSLAVLREELANDFGAVLFYRAAIRFP